MAGASPPVLITFAIPHESSDLRRHGFRGGEYFRIVHTGIGSCAASAALKKALENDQPKILISAGYAGGLAPELRVADVIADSQRSDPSLITRLQAHVRRGKFLSVDAPLEGVRAKEAVYRETGAMSVDMETEAIAAACVEARLPALFVRAISDAADDELPLPFPISYDIRRQRPRPFAVCFALLRSPAKIPRFVHFLRDLKLARTALTQTLSQFLASYRAIA